MRRNQLKSQIQGLYRRQEALGRQLDHAYMHDNMVDYLAIEARHRRIALIIERLWPKLDPKSRRDLPRNI